MTASDLARLDRIRNRLLPDDADWLAERLAPAWYTRRLRMSQRDAAIRELADGLADMRPTRKAETIADELGAYAANGWCREREVSELPLGPLRRVLWHRVLRQNSGEPLAWRQVLNIMNDRRGG